MSNLIPMFSVNMPPKEILMPALEKTLYSGYVGQGPKVDEFEKVFGEYIGNQNVLALNSGTSALHLAYRLAGVEGGEVITSPMTCTATNMPILANGGEIVWADINPITGILDAADVERKITKRTRAIAVVDWGGSPGDLGELARIRDKYGLALVEDAAHALGARYRGKSIGGDADYTCFSFQAIKHITTVDGGILAIKDTDAFKRGKLLRWYGIDREGERKDFRCEEDIKEWGYKFHMNDVTATMGIVQMARLNEIVKKHKENAEYYDLHIKWSKGFRPVSGYPYGESSNWLYTLLLPSGLRDYFFHHMQTSGVQVSRVHERNDKHSAFRGYERTLPGVDEFCSRMVCIPVHAGLSLEQRERVVEAVNSFDKIFSVGP